VQLLTGLLVVPLLATHAVGISMAANAGLRLGYADAIRLFWLQAPAIGLMQVVMLSVVWVHGCAGLFTWLRSKESAERAIYWLYLFAVIVPVVALLGYAQAGREMLIAGHAGSDLAKLSPMPEGVVVPFSSIKQITNTVITGSIVLAALTLAEPVGVMVVTMTGRSGYLSMMARITGTAASVLAVHPESI